MNERLKTHSKTQKKSADLVSNKLRIGVFQRYQMKCKSVSKKSPRYRKLVLPSLALGLVFGYAMKNSGLWLAARSAKTAHREQEIKNKA
ncbi:hypothetical protein HT520_002791 [Escherichia coli]|nr:hypothetical protein [Escherichia coli]